MAKAKKVDPRVDAIQRATELQERAKKEIHCTTCNTLRIEALEILVGLLLDESK